MSCLALFWRMRCCAIRAWIWDASCGVLPGWQEDGVKGGKGREVLPLTVAGYLGVVRKALDTGINRAHGRTEEKEIQRAGVDVRSGVGKPTNRYELYFVFSNVQPTLSVFTAIVGFHCCSIDNLSEVHVDY